jgi:hypothetical protein
MALRWSWVAVGNVQLVTAKLVFPKVGQTPGVYRLSLIDRSAPPRIYVGEAASLAKRFQGYRNPGPSQMTNLRMSPVMCELLAAGGQITVEISVDAHATLPDGADFALDLTAKSARVLVERAAEVAARRAGVDVLNL